MGLLYVALCGLIHLAYTDGAQTLSNKHIRCVP